MSRLDRLGVAVQRAGQLAGIAVTARGLTGDHAVRGPLYAQISVSDPCDHRCVMCCYHPPSETRPLLEQFGGARPGVMELDTFDALVAELFDEGTRQIDLVGRGEPLLNPHVVEMVARAKRRGMTVTMISNGSRLGARASELVAAGLDRFRLSLDAGRPETYPLIHVSESAAAFTRVTEGLAALVRARGERPAPHVSASFTINALNYRELVDMVDIVRSAGADAAHFQHVLPLTPEGSATVLDAAALEALRTDLVPAAIEQATVHGLDTNLRTFVASPATDVAGGGVVPCYVGSYFTVVLGNGHVMPCCQTQRPVGSLSEGGFSEVWNGARYREFRRAARNLPEPSPALETCECDRCYFRPHNVSVHNALHPLARIAERSEALLSVSHLLRMSRLDRR
ncbi:MAG: radical SAM protein [Myxococcota bacterium]|nr:radical SAM protein [Myxococcota bacterium]